MVEDFSFITQTSEMHPLGKKWRIVAQISVMKGRPIRKAAVCIGNRDFTRDYRYLPSPSKSVGR